MTLINPYYDNDNAVIKTTSKNDAIKTKTINIFAEFKDDNGIIELEDVKYTSNGLKCNNIIDWFKTHTGKWTNELKAEICKLIDMYNISVTYSEQIRESWQKKEIHKPLEKTSKQETNLKEAVLNLKPGETLIYTMPNNIQKEITRLENGTIAEFTPIRTRDSKTYNKKLATVYDSNMNKKIYEQFYSKLGIYTRMFDENGDATSVITVIDSNSSNGLNGARLLDKYKDSKDTFQDWEYSTERFLDINGNQLISYQNGEYYNSKGKIITKEQAIKILDKAIVQNKIAKIIQEY